MSEQELEGVIGRVALMEWRNAPTWDRGKIVTWAAGLHDLPDKDFRAECASRILDSAIMQGFKGNYEGIHARATACHTESERRHEAVRHNPACRAQSLYELGYNDALRSQGHAWEPSPPCCMTDSDKERR